MRGERKTRFQQKENEMKRRRGERSISPDPFHVLSCLLLSPLSNFPIFSVVIVISLSISLLLWICTSMERGDWQVVLRFLFACSPLYHYLVYGEDWIPLSLSSVSYSCTRRETRETERWNNDRHESEKKRRFSGSSFLPVWKKGRKGMRQVRDITLLLSSPCHFPWRCHLGCVKRTTPLTTFCPQPSWQSLVAFSLSSTHLGETVTGVGNGNGVWWDRHSKERK